MGYVCLSKEPCHPLIHGSAEGEALCRECEGVPRFFFPLAGRRPTYTVMSRCQKYPLDKFVSSEYICIIRKVSYDIKLIGWYYQGEGQCLYRTDQDEDNL